MIEKLEILDEYLNMLDNINNKIFAYEKIKEVNSLIEKTLIELKCNQQTLKENKSSENYKIIINNILHKIEMLEAKILPKANLLESFAKSKLNF